MKTSEVLNKAADLIEERGWVQGGGWLAAFTGSGSLCLEGGIMAAAGVPHIASRYDCVAFAAVSRYLDTAAPLFDWNDAEGRTAEEVIATLRAAAVIEAAKESADDREQVTA